MPATTARLVPAMLLLLAITPASPAQEISWRYDYGKAVAEAARTGKPLFIDVGSENCYWCKQLDARSLSDEKIIKLLGSQFIPLKVNGSKNAYLVKALRISSYPTLVFAAPDGNIVGYKEGFQDARTLEKMMLDVAANLNVPANLTRDYEAAVKAMEAKDLTGALALLEGVVADGKDRPIQAKAREMIADIERRTAEAKHQVPATLASRQGAEATKLAQEIKADPEAAKLACEQMSEQLGQMYLALADHCITNGKAKEAVSYLERVTVVAPGSRLSEQAQAKLAKVRGGLK